MYAHKSEHAEFSKDTIVNSVDRLLMSTVVAHAGLRSISALAGFVHFKKAYTKFGLIYKYIG